ncbi:hypothetical protein [Qingshengfaniella alkalisoli]|uniref:AraC family transcriptional regulator n=1 Tax=Qingshengfaniella alkalisoli TaxID=2599296 RepID=A0A5B8I721_9RHOB|nr:hypothetical protein [Qingshengfaniella alkalisoli]QDY69339.1 hypothetical protein FPZ52_06650 [Qingshengfaniella alkalisoli]
MFDTQSNDTMRRHFQIVSIGHLAKEGGWGVDAPRSYLVPVLLWFTSGQGRISIDGEVRGFTAHNAIYLPANTPVGCDVGKRTQGTAIFFGGHHPLPKPQETLHLRLHGLQKQTDFNQLIESLMLANGDPSVYRDEMVFHHAALTLLWLARESHVPQAKLKLLTSHPEDEGLQQGQG